MQWCVAKASQRCQEGWPQDPTTLPGHEKWTYGGARGVFAESPNRVSLLGGGELPNLKRPPSRLLTDIGPNVLFRVAGLPWRNANIATPPGNGGSRQDPAKGMEACRGAVPPYREMGVDARWEHCIIMVNAEGKIIEEWTQWDHLFKRPHAVYISPYDAQKRVWAVDDNIVSTAALHHLFWPRVAHRSIPAEVLEPVRCDRRPLNRDKRGIRVALRPLPAIYAAETLRQAAPAHFGKAHKLRSGALEG
jgi:hypothetical protein